VRLVSVAEEELLHEWRGLLARHATVCGALEAELRRRHGIGVSEFEALERLATVAHGKCRGVELTEAVHLSQSAASRLVARMERDGLVERAICPEDRRAIFIALTDAGRQRYHEAKPTQRAVLAATLR
jgi:DNA-binding MarR family transcriptional regulator